ncbi:expressed tetratricopeptide repeat protein [Nitzschia inconspicua]|uniref:Expressed tetratricopeptide repeat protein n=1 Tax=Nitzschia inconspicua TaxID=303405 RepID=A0A9K3LC40_9STRA|nr:expressed tetratricopeptide repeat protein [Nitzschia inconspicua]
MSTGEAGDRWQRRHSSSEDQSQRSGGNSSNNNNPSTTTNRAYNDEGGESYHRYRVIMRDEEDADTGLLPPSDAIPSPMMGWRDVDDDGDGDGRNRIIRRNSGSGMQEQKLVELTTPSLVDEDDYYEDEAEEQEMVALEHERIRRNAAAPIGAHHYQHRAFFVNEEDLRRTPGAQMYRSSFDPSAFERESVRRTPGASKMHGSAIPSSGTTLSQSEASSSNDASGLGFGLTLSTPIATSKSGGKQIGVSRSTWEQQSSSRGNAEATATRGSASSVSSGGAFVSPWSTFKNQQQQSESDRGVYSPNTLRLTEDLDNLLLEDDDVSDETRKFNQFVFRTSSSLSKSLDESEQQQSNESWTAPYVVSMEQPSRVPRGAAGRGRKNRLDQARRTRGGFSGSSSTYQVPHQRSGGFVPYAQAPTPVRGAQGQFFDISTTSSKGQVPSPDAPNFSTAFMGHAAIGQPSFVGYGQHSFSSSNSAPVNFGGAFSPPTKVPPIGSSALTEETHGAEQNRFSSHQVSVPPVPKGAQPPAGTFDCSGQQAMNPFEATQFHAQHTRPSNIQPPNPQFGMPHHSNIFAGGHPMSQSPAFTFPHPQSIAFHMPPGMHQQPMMSNMAGPPGMPQFPPQSWPTMIQVQYEGMGPTQPHAVQGGWPVGGFQQPYLMQAARPPPNALDPSAGRMLSSPTPAWTPEVDTAQAMEMQATPSAPHPPVGTPHSIGRPPSRGKNVRKGQTKKWGSNKGPSRSVDRANSDVSSTTPTFGKKPQNNSKGGKKKVGKDRSTPVPGDRPSSTVSEEIVDSSVGALEDPAEAKRAELSESPAVRSAFKDFYRQFRAEEKSSLKRAEDFAMRSLKDGSIPESVHWRIHLEVADLIKRSNRFEEARKLFQQACQLQPYASQVWLEYSKLEEECGNMEMCTKILEAGLQYCEYSENLLSRAIKHEEKLGNLSRARELLSRLKHVGIEKVWRSVLEGALLESRAGNDVMARRVLKYLMHHVPWYGPLYLEAFKLEKDLGRSRDALAIVERGLAAIPRYGPLWFSAFRLCEELDVEEKAYRLPRSMGMVERAIFNISKELMWKVHLEAAQMLERSSTEYMTPSSDANQILLMCRKRFAMTIATCPPSLRWKVWLAAGRMEVAAGNSDIARRLFHHAHRVVPDKGRAVALLECARLEEFVGDVELANAILCRSRLIGGSDWKVWLESVMLSIRSGDYPRAVSLSQQALEQHSGTGRLWASLIQLLHFSEGEKAQFTSLKHALNAVPKSGEVWCEGARIHLNPFSHTFDLQRASRHLFFATKFTPQYGDGFLESLRLVILVQLLLPIAARIWEESKEQLPGQDDDEWDQNLTKYVFKLVCELYRIRDAVSSDDMPGVPRKSLANSYLGESVIKPILERLYSEDSLKFLDITRLELRCANADPNYGPLWFYCRARPTDTARTVLGRAVDVVLDDIKYYANVYIAALVRRFAITSRFERHHGGGVAEGTLAWEQMMDEICLSTPSLSNILENGCDFSEAGVEFLESSIPPSDFITGIVALSRHRPIDEMTSYERRKTLFGSDSIFS